MPAQRDYYEILCVPRNASEGEIKRAYRDLARRAHPDTVQDGEARRSAEARFKEINAAYAVLSDPNKRAQYDRFGSVEGPFAGGFGGFAGSGVGDIFDFFFGGGVREPQGPARGSDLRYDLEVELLDVLHGASREVSFNHLGRCPSCKGSGSTGDAEPVTCPDCHGSGEVRHARQTMLGQFVTAVPCVRCGGRGRVVRNPCKICNGTGRSPQPRSLSVKVPLGVQDGTRLRYAGMGEAGERGGPSGDLYVYVGVKPHPVFRRDGVDVHCEVALSFTQAALGATLEVDGLDEKATLKVPPGTQTGTSFRIGGQGLPRQRGGSRGDLVIDVSVAVPKKLTRRQREILEEFARAGGEEVEDKDLFTKVRKAFAGD